MHALLGECRNVVSQGQGHLLGGSGMAQGPEGQGALINASHHPRPGMHGHSQCQG